MSNIYNASHVRLQKILARKYNNPLGEGLLQLIARFIGSQKDIKIMDLGCGRGSTSLWLAHHTSAKIIGVEPSWAMISEAWKALKRCKQPSQLKLILGTLDRIDPQEKYDIIIALDVLSWVHNKKHFLNSVRNHLKPKGLFIMSDYFAEKRNTGLVKKLCEAWSMQIPPSFKNYHRLFISSGLKPLLIVDTTREYLNHWLIVQRKLKAKLTTAIRLAGKNAVQQMSRQIKSIVSATSKLEFGHILVFSEKK